VCLAVALLIAGGELPAQDWMSGGAGDSAVAGSLDPLQFARFPPVERLSYEAEFPEQPLLYQPSTAGYQNGFLIASDDRFSASAGDFPFLMRINSWSQLRHTLFRADDPDQDLNKFSFERLRFAFGGHAFSPDLRYFFQFDGNSDQAAQAVFLDYFLTYDLGCAWWGGQAGKLGVKVGQWKVPFSRSREESGRRLQFTERATANLFFDLNRSIGVGLFGEVDRLALPVQFETALFNGFQTGGDTDIRDAGLDENLAWSGRIYTDLFSEFGADGEPDLSWHATPTLRIGSGLAFTRVSADGENEFARQRVVDSGQRLASLLPAGVKAYNIWFYTLDTHFKYRGFSAIAEYYWRSISQFQGGSVDDLLDHGFVLQVGYFALPGKLELLSRWSRIAGDSGTLGRGDQSTDEVAVGAAWYFRGHNAKIVFDLSHIDGMAVSSPRLDILPGGAGWLLRSQLQLGF
jgi:hypothetical protein